VLFIGDTSKIVLGINRAITLPIQTCKNPVNAIELLSETSFTRIIIQYSCTSYINSLLESIKKTAPQAKIQLAIEMSQEIAAKELIEQNLANDYFISPVSLGKFKKYILDLEPIIATSPSDTVSKLELYQRRIQILEKLATEDDLTGVKNRRYLLAFLNRLITRAQTEDIRIHLLVFDIDNFKKYNDLCGHPVGDRVLQQTSKMMRQSSRSHDVIARIGGDEFAVVFWDWPANRKPTEQERRTGKTNSPLEFVTIINRFKKLLSTNQLPDLGAKGPVELTISGGIATYCDNCNTVQQLLQQADNALLEAKNSGKNRVYLVGEPTMTEIY
jgi:diguanylate cyclase (GGDEF)-like protein